MNIVTKEGQLDKDGPRDARVPLTPTLNEILDASIAITGADYGNIQILNAEGTGLIIAAQRGFKKDFLEHFKVVPIGHALLSCSRAAETKGRVMTGDVETDSAFAEYRETARTASFRAMQSTPLLSHEGKLLGVLSTYFRQPRLPDGKSLHMLDMYMQQASHVIELLRYGRKIQSTDCDDSEISTLPVHESGNEPHATVASSSPFNVIWSLPFFSELNAKERTELLRISNFKHFHRNETVFAQGNAICRMHWVCKGAVQIFRLTPEGRELTSRIATIGNILSEHDALLDDQPHSFSARTIQETTLFSVPIGWIREGLACSHNRLVRSFIDLFATCAQDARIEVEHQATFSAAQHIACYLQHICVINSFDPRGFTLPYTKGLIASRLGMELSSVSRTLPKLRELGISVTGKHVSFDDLRSTQHFSCDACAAAENCRIRKAMLTLENTSERKNGAGRRNNKS